MADLTSDATGDATGDHDYTEFRLRVGEVVIALRGRGADFAASLAEYFMCDSDTDAVPDIQLDLQVYEHEDRPEIPSSLFTNKRFDQGSFTIADELVHGRYDAATGKGELWVKAALIKGRSIRIFEQLLLMAYYSAAERRGIPSGTLVHGAGIVHQGRGYLFVGASGAGKSTVARLSSEQQVLNDEISLVLGVDTAGPELCATPFNGYCRDKVHGRAPLQAILLLRQGDRHLLGEPSRAAAAAELASQIVPPVGLTEALTEQSAAQALEAALQLVARVPIRMLTFSQDPGFWPLIADTFGAGSSPTLKA